MGEIIGLSDVGPWRQTLAPLARSATEMATCVYLDEGARYLGARHFLSRSMSMVELSVRSIVIDALALDARLVVLAHNHPSGNLEPSREDISFTRRLFVALEVIDVRLIDHYIVSAERVLSFRAASIL